MTTTGIILAIATIYTAAFFLCFWRVPHREDLSGGDDLGLDRDL